MILIAFFFSSFSSLCQVFGSVQPHRAGATVRGDRVGQHGQGARAHRGRTDPPCAAECSVELC